MGLPGIIERLVESTRAAFCFPQVLRPSTMYDRMLAFFKNIQASSMKKALFCSR